MYIRGAITACALEDVGLIETPPASNIIKFNDWYYSGKSEYNTTKGTDKYVPSKWPYCGTSVSFWYYHGCTSYFYMHEVDGPNGFCSVPNMYKRAVKEGWLTNTPLTDDVVLMDFKGDGTWDHTGVFEKWEKEGYSFWCVEGNTSPNEKGSQGNGGGCYRRLRYVNANGMKSVFVNVIDNQK